MTERDLGMEENIRKVFLVLMAAYAYVLNPMLLISMLFSLLLTIIAVLFTEANDEEIRETLMQNRMTDDIVRKYSRILCFGGVLFLVLTEIIYSAILNIK